MNIFSILATVDADQAAESAAIVPIDQIWHQITNLGILEALTFIAFGTVCLLYGWRVFKILVVICFAAAGLIIGSLISEIIVGTANPLIAVLAGIVLAVLSIPLMRWGVSVLGAIAGGILTAALWYALQMPEKYIWMGALVGIVAGGMISFIVFRIAVMLFSSLGGSTLIMAGALALFYHYSFTSDHVHRLVFNYNWFMPLLLLIPTAVGIFLQNKFIKGHQDWSL
ncbi:MAG: DUF4203 domain-containing protein [Phycisphaerae bacterium]|nr:DUF4203 domain-containing protein [Phycisphaerae bacterium]